MGLVTMRERAAAAGGTLTINSTLWQGTTVEMIALLDSTAAREASPAFED
jgi:signal transduction histidine kinase